MAGHGLEAGAAQRRRGGVDVQRGALERGVQEHGVEGRVVLHVHLLLAALDLVERRLSDVDVAAFDQHRELAVEEGQQQRTDVAAVDVRVGHQDDAVVAQLVDVEFFAADAAAERGDQRADFGGRQHLVEAGPFDVQDLALQRQDGLGAAVTTLLGRAAGRITLDDEQFGERGIFLLAVGQLAGQAGDIQRALAAGHLAGLAGGFAGAGRLDELAGDGLGLLGVLEQELRQFLGNGGFDDALDLGRHQLVLGLRGELRVRQLHGQDGGEPFARVVTRGGHLLALGDAFLFDVIVERARERSTEAGQVRAAVLLRNVVRVAEHRLLVGIVPLHRHLDADRAFLAAEPDHRVVYGLA